MSRLMSTLMPFLYPRQALRSWTNRRSPVCSSLGITSSLERPKSREPSRRFISSELDRSRTDHINAQHQTATRSRQRTRDDFEGTMTSREKELFGKIFESILAKEQSSLQEGNSRATVSFEQNSHASDSVNNNDKPHPESTLAKDYISQYPQTLQKEVLQAQAVVQTKLARLDSTRARSAPNYIQAKDELYSFKEITQVYHFLEENLFGPFTRGEVLLQEPTTEILEFCRAYPLLLADVLCIFRLSFKDYSACLSTFVRMKTLGIESRAIGGSTEVYNEMLLTVFEGWHDLGMVEQLLEEMRQDAIVTDDQTTVILRYIRSTIVSEREGTLAGQAYWSRVRPRRFELLNRHIHESSNASSPYID